MRRGLVKVIYHSYRILVSDQLSVRRATPGGASELEFQCGDLREHAANIESGDHAVPKPSDGSA